LPEIAAMYLMVTVALTQGLAIFAMIMIIWSAFFGSYLFSSVKQYELPKPEQLKLSQREDNLRRFVCYDRDVVNHLQRQLWMAAHRETLGKSKIAINDKDMDFYHEGYGSLDVTLESNRNNFTSLVYYRIYKVGNDNIRSLLFEYAFNASGDADKFAASGCPSDSCAHMNVQRLGMWQVVHATKMYSSDRFVFTFVRHPIVRFISGMNEIESRARPDIEKTKLMKLKHPVGSVERVMEFIDMIIASGGSGKASHFTTSQIQSEHLFFLIIRFIIPAI
jgi:hypothetical protein